MKVIKRGLYIATFIISLLIININARAYDIQYNDDITINEEYIYDKFISAFPDFNINEYPNIYCNTSNKNGSGQYYLTCYAFNNYTIEYFTYTAYSSGGFQTSFSSDMDVTLADFYEMKYLPVSKLYQTKIHRPRFTLTSFSSIKDKAFTNFNLNGLNEDFNLRFNVLDFSKYLQPQEPEVPELEINIKATKLLDFIIDKAKNIYEVLINSEIFKLILSIPLIYLVFLVLSRTIKK